MDKIKIRYNNWDAVPISKYKRIVDICDSDDIDEIGRSVGVVAELTDLTEDDVWNLPMEEVNRLVNNCRWINKKLDFRKHWTVNSVKLGDMKCKVEYDLKKMTISQYVDFQQAWKMEDPVEKLVPVLSCFIIPEGHKYGEGYDIEELQKAIEKYLPITLANSICFFFVKKLQNSIKASLTSSQMVVMAMKYMMKKGKWSKEIMEKMDQAEKNLIQMQSISSHGYIW